MKTSNFVVKWRHDEDERSCTCFIEDQNGGLIADATLKKYYSDPDNKVYARKHSFERAVNQISNRSARTELWKGLISLSPKYTKVK